MVRRDLMTKKAILMTIVAFSCVPGFVITPSVCPAQCVAPTNDLFITSNTELCPGAYNIDDTGAKGVMIIQSSNIIVDCKGSSLLGNGSGYAIYNDGFDNVTIRNCKISNYFSGIYLKNCTKNKISQNECRNSRIGIAIDGVTQSEVYENTLFNNNDGISVRHSSSNRMSNNELCGSHECDIKIGQTSTGNSGHENECDKPCNWSDANATGCSYSCDVCPDWDSDGICDGIDNCKYDSNPGQKDTDGDGVGDVCDNCVKTSNPIDPVSGVQSDSDVDGLGNACDNCPTVSNLDQVDRDNNGSGDLCDCQDGFMSTNEDGADCGGICSTSCPKCIPIIKNGHPSTKIDIVFVPDTDYGGNTKRFLTDVKFLIQNGYFGATELNNNRCKFNFYYYAQAGDYQPVCQKWDLPQNYSADCSFADSAAIIFTGGGRACSSSVFSAPPGNTTVIVHETGHKIFGMADEYCCDGGYFQPKAPHPNIFHSNSDCTSKSETPANCRNFCAEQRCDWSTNNICRQFAMANGFDPNECVGTCSPNWCNWRASGFTACCVDGGDGWWKSDPNSCTMISGTVFGPDCHERVLDNLSSLPNCSSTPSPNDKPGVPKVIILGFNIRGDEITLRSSRIVYNHPPNYFLKDGEFLIRALSDAGEELFSFVRKDPRNFYIFGDVDNPPSRMTGKYVDFDFIVPFFPKVKVIEIRNYSSGELLEAFDIGNTIHTFCIENPGDEYCQND
jgi:parallel beta-helix repeat protein